MKVKLENLTKIFPGRNKGDSETTAVSNFTYEIPDGKLIGLLGPSGCGKSTTLFMLSGLLKPSSGKIYFGDDDVTNLTPEKRGVGLVFQNYALYPHMTVFKNLAFSLTFNFNSANSSSSFFPSDKFNKINFPSEFVFSALYTIDQLFLTSKSLFSTFSKTSLSYSNFP